MKKDILYPLRCLHGLMADGPERLRSRQAFLRKIRRERRQYPGTVLLVMTPEHGNLGDHAIAWAAGKLLEEAGFHCLEIPQDELTRLWQQGNLSAMNGLPIAINGGGNIGSLWPDVEMMMEQIAEENPKSPLVILPNTAVFEDSPEGQAIQTRACRVFGNHRNLTIYAREKTSFETMQNLFPRVKLAPDLVLSLKWEKPETLREGCILCLRSDREKTRTESQELEIRRQAENCFGSRIRELDMVSDRSFIPTEEHQSCVLQQMEAFAGAELVITDRLHAMILCAVTGTPCIVLASRSPKIRGCYQWISGLDYIKLAEIGEIEKKFSEIPRGRHSFAVPELQEAFENLKEDLKTLL